MPDQAGGAEGDRGGGGDRSRGVDPGGLVGCSKSWQDFTGQALTELARLSRTGGSQVARGIKLSKGRRKTLRRSAARSLAVVLAEALQTGGAGAGGAGDAAAAPMACSLHPQQGAADSAGGVALPAVSQANPQHGLASGAGGGIGAAVPEARNSSVSSLKKGKACVTGAAAPTARNPVRNPNKGKAPDGSAARPLELSSSSDGDGDGAPHFGSPARAVHAREKLLRQPPRLHGLGSGSGVGFEAARTAQSLINLPLGPALPLRVPGTDPNIHCVAGVVCSAPSEEFDEAFESLQFPWPAGVRPGLVAEAPEPLLVSPPALLPVPGPEPVIKAHEAVLVSFVFLQLQVLIAWLLLMPFVRVLIII